MMVTLCRAIANDAGGENSMADGCASHGWSIVTSASTNSQFAGVLAGFVFTGIVILFTMRGARYTQALAVLCPTFVVLGFDSYAFSHVTGSIGDTACGRVWTDGMFASGMLGVGASGVVMTIGWLVAAHLDGDSPTGPLVAQQGSSMELNLPRIASGMMYGVTVGITLLLAMTAERYIRFVTNERPGSTWIWIIWGVPVAVALVIFALILVRSPTVRPHKHRLALGQAFRRRSLLVAVYGMLAYGVFAPVIAGVLLALSDQMWARPHSMIIGLTVGVELIVAAALLITLLLAAPPMPPRGRGHVQGTLF
jgi:hypothetical protein